MSPERESFLRGPARDELVAQIVNDCPGATADDVNAVYDTVIQECKSSAFGRCPDRVFAMSAIYPALHAATLDQVCRRIVHERKRYIASRSDELLKRFCVCYPWIEEHYARAAKLDPRIVETCLFCTDPAQFVDQILIEEWRRMACVEMVNSRN